jgi:hypothetical protein
MKIAAFLYSLATCLNTSPANTTVFVDGFDCKNINGRIAYFSAGTLEDWRPDKGQYPKEAIGNALPGWKGERMVDIRNAKVRAILAKRMDLAKSKGAAGIDFDNVDTYTMKSGFPLTKNDQFDFVRWYASEAHKRGLLVGLKNSAETAKNLSILVDFHVVEECSKYKECDKYPQAKSFFIEYTPVSASVCKARPYTLFADMALKNFKRCP